MRSSHRVYIAAKVRCSWRQEALRVVQGKVKQKGTEWVSSVAVSLLQFELERTGAPFGCVTVEHGALGEGHVILCVDQDYCVGPE